MQQQPQPPVNQNNQQPPPFNLNNQMNPFNALQIHLANFQQSMQQQLLANMNQLSPTNPNTQASTNINLPNPCAIGMGTGNVCNMNADRVTGGFFVGKRDLSNQTINLNMTKISEGSFVGKRQWIGNTANVNAGTIGGGNFIGKRDNVKIKRQWIGNTANVNAGSITNGNFIGKRDNEKRQYTGNTANVLAENVLGGNFIGKREPNIVKRQWIGNTANVNAGTIGGGNFIGKRQIANLMASHIQDATFSGQANAMDGSMKGMSAVCDPVTGKCVNMMGKRETSRVKRQWIGNTANVNAGTIGGGNFIG